MRSFGEKLADFIAGVVLLLFIATVIVGFVLGCIAIAGWAWRLM